MIRNLGCLRHRGVLRNCGLLCVLAVDPAGCGGIHVAMLGIVSLIAFAVVFDSRRFGVRRQGAVAADGGIYIAASLLWLSIVERQRPTVTDLIGASIAILGHCVIVGFAWKVR